MARKTSKLRGISTRFSPQNLRNAKRFNRNTSSPKSPKPNLSEKIMAIVKSKRKSTPKSMRKKNRNRPSTGQNHTATKSDHESDCEIIECAHETVVVLDDTDIEMIGKTVLDESKIDAEVAAISGNIIDSCSTDKLHVDDNQSIINVSESIENLSCDNKTNSNGPFETTDPKISEEKSNNLDAVAVVNTITNNSSDKLNSINTTPSSESNVVQGQLLEKEVVQTVDLIESQIYDMPFYEDKNPGFNNEPIPLYNVCQQKEIVLDLDEQYTNDHTDNKVECDYNNLIIINDVSLNDLTIFDGTNKDDDNIKKSVIETISNEPTTNQPSEKSSDSTSIPSTSTENKNEVIHSDVQSLINITDAEDPATSITDNNETSTDSSDSSDYIVIDLTASPKRKNGKSKRKRQPSNDDSLIFVSETVLPERRRKPDLKRYIPLRTKEKKKAKRPKRDNEKQYNNPVAQTTSKTCYNPNKEKPIKGTKRMIIIDGSNVAFGHSCHAEFSVKGISICLEFFEKEGHEVKAVVPQKRLKKSLCSDNDLLDKLYRAGKIVLTPCKNIPGKCSTSYDDRFIFQLAEEFDAAIISNDNYRDLAAEKPEWRQIALTRVIGYSFCNDMFLLPPDPYGRSGPTLDQILNRIDEN